MRFANLAALALIAACCSPAAAKPAKPITIDPMGPLAVHTKNPRYFQNTATGRLIYLTGSHTWANLVDIGPSDPPPEFDFPACLKWMNNLNHNFIRLWTWELATWNTKANRENKLHTAAPQPFARTGPGKALDGKPKFDLKKFNPAYFDRLRNRILLAQNAEIYISIMLFEGWGLQFSQDAWSAHPFNPKNNINNIDGDSNKDGKGVEIHTLADRKVTALQEAYVRKVIDTANHFDNVLYEISNENHPPSTKWQYYMIRLIKSYEKTKPKQHPVGMTFQYRGGKNEDLFNSPADWISPNNQGGYRDNPPAADGRKVILNDTDHLWGIGGNQDWVWKSFTRGHNPIFMDPYDGVVLGSPFDPKWQPIRKALGHTRTFALKMDLAKMLPRPDLASTKFCLANPGSEYLIYSPSPNTDSFTVNLKPGTYKYEWFNPNSGKTASTGKITAKTAPHKFRPPAKTPAVLHIKKAAPQPAISHRRVRREKGTGVFYAVTIRENPRNPRSIFPSPHIIPKSKTAPALRAYLLSVANVFGSYLCRTCHSRESGNPDLLSLLKQTKQLFHPQSPDAPPALLTADFYFDAAGRFYYPHLTMQESQSNSREKG